MAVRACLIGWLRSIARQGLLARHTPGLVGVARRAGRSRLAPSRNKRRRSRARVSRRRRTRSRPADRRMPSRSAASSVKSASDRPANRFAVALAREFRNDLVDKRDSPVFTRTEFAWAGRNFRADGYQTADAVRGMGARARYFFTPSQVGPRS